MSTSIEEKIARYEKERVHYKTLNRCANPLERPSGQILGRDFEVFRRSLRNPEKANLALLAEPGTGKTALVQGFAYDVYSKNYLTLSVAVEQLVEDSKADKETEMQKGLVSLFSEVKAYSKANDCIVVLFIDEFHRIIMESPVSIEALKPILEHSASNGFRIIAATTFEEYETWITPNRALDQRFLRRNVEELMREAVIEVLRNRAKVHGVYELSSPKIFGEIYDISRQYLPSNSQPRASIDIMNSMIALVIKDEEMINGELVKTYMDPSELEYPSPFLLNHYILAEVIRLSYSIDIDHNVDIDATIKKMKTNLFEQDAAIDGVMDAIRLARVGFADPTRPMYSFLSVGTTGTGKALLDSELILTPKGFVRNGDLKVGDIVYDRNGFETTVEGVYPRGLRDVYRVLLEDGRYLDCSKDHLWTYRVNDNWKTASVSEMLGEKDELFVPNNKALNLSDKDLSIDPYIIGLIIASSVEHEAFERFAFSAKEQLYYLLKDLKLSDLENFVTAKIPLDYRLGSIGQRWSLLKGLFDVAGEVIKGHYILSLSNDTLLNDVASVIWSLGVTPEMGDGYLSVAVSDFGGRGDLRSELVKIVGIEDLGYQEKMTCIMVDNEEHLYQAGETFVVTHNTELAKQVSAALGVRLVRFDMSIYSKPESVDLFVSQLVRAAWSYPNAYILIDEVEKSCREVINILLQVLDDARLTAPNNINRIIAFTGCIINLTTNVGSDMIQSTQSTDAKIEEGSLYNQLASDDRFETAVLGRIDDIIVFNPLKRESMIKIAQSVVDSGLVNVTTKKRQVLISDVVVKHIAIDRISRDSERGGARDVRRQVRAFLFKKLAKVIDQGKEVPLMVGLSGDIRYQHKEIGDPDGSQLSIYECHPRELVEAWMKQISLKIGKQLYDDGLFIPSEMSVNDFVIQIMPYIKAGHTRFKTEIFNDEISFVPVVKD